MADLDRVLIVSHEDFDPYASLVVKFAEDKSLNICYEYTFSEDPSMSFTKVATIDKDSAYQLARRKKISLLDLPNYFADKFESDSWFCYPSDVEALFAEVINFLLDNHVSYRIR